MAQIYRDKIDKIDARKVCVQGKFSTVQVLVKLGYSKHNGKGFFIELRVFLICCSHCFQGKPNWLL